MNFWVLLSACRSFGGWFFSEVREQFCGWRTVPVAEHDDQCVRLYGLEVVISNRDSIHGNQYRCFTGQSLQDLLVTEWFAIEPDDFRFCSLCELWSPESDLPDAGADVGLHGGVCGEFWGFEVFDTCDGGQGHQRTCDGEFDKFVVFLGDSRAKYRGQIFGKCWRFSGDSSTNDKQVCAAESEKFHV